jgi:hypothetical protein
MKGKSSIWWEIYTHILNEISYTNTDKILNILPSPTGPKHTSATNAQNVSIKSIYNT